MEDSGWGLYGVPVKTVRGPQERLSEGLVRKIGGEHVVAEPDGPVDIPELAVDEVEVVLNRGHLVEEELEV